MAAASSASYRDDHGTNFIDSGPAIYVYVGYRLGIFGFLADKALGAHSGDYGLMDRQAALRWVKHNIGAFGGNGHNVTIFGESAGGASVCDQVASPTARGLFERGISISGFNDNTIWWPADCKSKLQTEYQAQAVGAKFAAKVGCGAARDVGACLRGLPPAKLVAAAGTYENPTGGGSIGPIANGTTLPTSAAKIFAEGKENKVPLIIGVGEDEFNGGVYSNSPGHTVVANTAAQYRSLVRHIPVYAYQDDDGDSPAEVSGTPQPLGANHSAVNRLVHDVPSTLDANQLVLQQQVLTEWASFARDGDPAPSHTPPWPAYAAHHHPVMALLPAGDSQATPRNVIAAAHHCGFWDVVDRSAPWAVH